MKKLFVLFFALACITTISCMHNGHNINITYNDDDHYYSMNAHFPKGETRNVEEYMDSRIGRKSNMSLANTQTDATLTLDDHTIFYMKKYPGFVEIKQDKNANSDSSYHEIKSLCDGIKKLLTHN